jgi:hypothetical protein
MVGGLVRLAAERTPDPDLRHERREKGVLYGSGLIAGGGVMGILVAALYNAHVQRETLLAAGEPVGRLTAATASFYDFVNIGHGWAGGLAGVVALAAFAGLTFTLVRSVWSRGRLRGA